VIDGASSIHQSADRTVAIAEIGWEVAAWLVLEGWPVQEERTTWAHSDWANARVVPLPDR
jgi:hypothetical protein